MTVKLLTEHHLAFLSLKGGYTAWFESTLVKMTHCWKSNVTAHIKRLVGLVISALWQKTNNVAVHHRKTKISLGITSV